MSNIFENMFNWKLNTWEDWLYFLVVGATFTAVLLVIFKVLENGRTKKAATRRVSKKLKKSCPKGTKLYDHVILSYDGQSFALDHLAVGAFGIIICRTFNWGTSVYGEPRSETWKIVDMKKTEVIPNPVMEIEDNAAALTKKILTKSNIYNVPVEPLVVFADTYDTPRLFLGKVQNAVVYRDIKPYILSKRAQKNSVENIDKLIALIDTHITPGEIEKK